MEETKEEALVEPRMPPSMDKESMDKLKYWVADELLVNVRAGNMP